MLPNHPSLEQVSARLSNAFDMCCMSDDDRPSTPVGRGFESMAFCTKCVDPSTKVMTPTRCVPVGFCRMCGDTSCHREDHAEPSTEPRRAGAYTCLNGSRHSVTETLMCTTCRATEAHKQIITVPNAVPLGTNARCLNDSTDCTDCGLFLLKASKCDHTLCTGCFVTAYVARFEEVQNSPPSTKHLKKAALVQSCVVDDDDHLVPPCCACNFGGTPSNASGHFGFDCFRILPNFSDVKELSDEACQAQIMQRCPSRGPLDT